VEILQRHLRLVRAEIPTVSEPLLFGRAGGRQVRVEIQCSPMRHLNSSDTHVIMMIQVMPSRQERLEKEREWFQHAGLTGVLYTILHNPLQAITHQVDILKEALQQAMPPSSVLFKQSLITIKAAIDNLHHGLDQLRMHTDTLFSDLYSSLNVLYLQADLLDEALKQMTAELYTEVERALAAIQAGAHHIQTVSKRESWQDGQ
jgi:hypothetical protein